MATVRTRKRKMSEEAFLRLPDDGRKYELVRGITREVPTGVRHGAIIAKIIALMFPYAQGRGVITASSAGYRMVSGNIRSPDVAFIRKERLPEGKPPIGFGESAPDLAIEVLSPSEDLNELLRKVAEYFESGAQQVWVLDPDACRATFYRSPIEVQTLRADDTLEGEELLPEFRCKVRELLGETSGG